MKYSLTTGRLNNTLGRSLRQGYNVHTIYHSQQTIHLATTKNDTIDRLLQDPDVEFIECDRHIDLYYSEKRDHAPVPSWGLDRINQKTLPLDNTWGYDSHTGVGVHIFVIDTGIDYEHPEFQGRLSDGYNVIRSRKKTSPLWNDGNGHGTHCAGIAAGATYGVAREAILHAVRVLNNKGSGTLTGVINGISWVTDYHLNHDYPSVASVSLGSSYSPSFNAAIRDSILAGVVYSVAAGNEGEDACGSSPASAPGVISVGATDINDLSPDWSNFGDCVNVYAPGVGITSAWKGSTSNTISGTSMACPHVTGAIALFLEENTYALPSEVLSSVVTYATSGYPSNAADGKFLYTGNGFLTDPTPATHEETPVVINPCLSSGDMCKKHGECCSGRCSGFRSKVCS